MSIIGLSGRKTVMKDKLPIDSIHWSWVNKVLGLLTKKQCDYSFIFCPNIRNMRKKDMRHMINEKCRVRDWFAQAKNQFVIKNEKKIIPRIQKYLSTTHGSVAMNYDEIFSEHPCRIKSNPEVPICFTAQSLYLMLILLDTTWFVKRV